MAVRTTPHPASNNSNPATLMPAPYTLFGIHSIVGYIKYHIRSRDESSPALRCAGNSRNKYSIKPINNLLKILIRLIQTLSFTAQPWPRIVAPSAGPPKSEELPMMEES